MSPTRKGERRPPLPKAETQPAAAAEPAHPVVPVLRITVEQLLYALLVMAALAIRLAELGRWPLNESEVCTALSAWRASRGVAWRAETYVPLLFDVDLLLFWLTRATDAATRLLPALVGTALVALPIAARDLLGRRGALVAAALLAFAPTWVHFSRAGDGAILWTAAGAGLWLAAVRYVQRRDPRAGRLGVIALGLGILSGPGFYTALLAGVLVCLYALWYARRMSEPQHPFAALRGAATTGNLMLFGGVVVLFGSGFLANSSGLGVAADLGGEWARALNPRQTLVPWLSYPGTLVGYEFVTLALAVVGAVVGLTRRERATIYLLIWVALVLLLGTLLGHREPLWLLDALLPMVVLAARGGEFVCEQLLRSASPFDGLVALLALPIVAFAFLQLAAYTQTGQERLLVYARLAIGVLVCGAIVYAFWVDRMVVLRAATAIILLLASGAMLRITTAVAYQTGRDPREQLVWAAGSASVPSSMQVRDLEDFVALVSSQRAGDTRLLDVAYEEALAPIAGWYLRDFSRALPVASVGPQPLSSALITHALPKEQWPEGYAGQRFRLRERWPSQKLSTRDRLRWLIYREPVGHLSFDEAQVWLRMPTGR